MGESFRGGNGEVGADVAGGLALERLLLSGRREEVWFKRHLLRRPRVALLLGTGLCAGGSGGLWDKVALRLLHLTASRVPREASGGHRRYVSDSLRTTGAGGAVAFLGVLALRRGLLALCEAQKKGVVPSSCSLE